MSSLFRSRGGIDQVGVKSPPVSQSLLFYHRVNARQMMHSRKETDKSKEQDQPIDFSRKIPSTYNSINSLNGEDSRDSYNSESSEASSISPEPRSSPIKGRLNPKDEPVILRPLEKPTDWESHPVRKTPISAELKPILGTTEQEPYFHHGRFSQHHTALDQQTKNPWIMNKANFDRTKIVSPTKTVSNGIAHLCQHVETFDNPPKALEQSPDGFTINNDCRNLEASQIGESNERHPHKSVRLQIENPLFPEDVSEYQRSDSYLQNKGTSPPLPSSSPRPLEESQQSRTKLAHPQPVKILNHTVDRKHSDLFKQFTNFPDSAPDNTVYSRINAINSALQHYSTLFPSDQRPVSSALQDVSLSKRLGLMPEVNGLEGLPQDLAGQKNEKRLFNSLNPNEIARFFEIPEFTPHVSSSVVTGEFPQMLYTRRTSLGYVAQESDIALDSQGKPNDLPTRSLSNSNEMNTLPPEVSGQYNQRNAHKLPDEMKDKAYYEKRRKNNAAAKRSRDTRRRKEDQLAIIAQQCFARYEEVIAELNELQCAILTLLQENNQLKIQLFARSVGGIDCNPRLTPSPKENGNEDQQY